jgi:hypothetical protein
MNALLTMVTLLSAAPLAAQEIEVTPLDDLLQDLTAPPAPQAPTVAPSVDVVTGLGGELRVLDKLTGVVTNLSLQQGESVQLGFLSVGMIECRYPVENPSGDAFTYIEVMDRKENVGLFAGWMLASAPALNAMDHPRYDVWALRCITS